MVVVRAGASDLIVGGKLREELTVTRVTVMEGLTDKILVLLISGNTVEFQIPEAWSSVDELEDNTDNTRGTSTEMLDA
jgi:hypothetical protein